MELAEDYEGVEITEFSNVPFVSFCNQSNTNTTTTTVPIDIVFIPLGLGIIIVTTLGIFGNALSAIVLTRKRLRSSYSVLTLGLTFSDTIYLLTKLIRYGLESLFSYYNFASSYTDVFLPIFGPYLRPLTFTAHTASTYFTMAIAFDRYIAISRPCKARSFCTTKQAGISSLLVILFAILYNVPRWWEFHTEQCDLLDIGNPNENITITKYSMAISELRINPEYKLYYIFWAYFIVLFVIPFVTLALLNFLIWRGITHMQRSGVILTSSQSRDASFAVMLVGVVVVFLVCNLDYLILDILGYFGIDYPVFWSHLGNFLLTLNSAVNFLIYCVCGRKFRQEFGKLLGQWCSCLNCNKSSASHDIQTSDAWINEQPRRQRNNINMYHIRQKQ